jgi:MFS family permease
MTWANFTGGISAIVCAWVLLRPWMNGGRSQFVYVFLFAGLMFLFAAVLSFGLRERPADEGTPVDGTWDSVRGALLDAWRNHNYRRLVLIGFLFGLSITLFPHYQSLGRQRLELGLGQLVPWLIAQNIGVTIFSIPVGWVADRLGNRLAIRVLLLVVSLTPVLALGLSRFVELGPVGFWLVFLLLGLFPITIRIVSNYALEIAPSDDQTKYLSVINLATSTPAIVCAPIVGWGIDLFGFEPPFLIVAGLVFLGFVLTPTLLEPRHLPQAARVDLWSDPEREA